MGATTVVEGAATGSAQTTAYPIRRVAVLGAGTMGSRIAAQVANAGFPALLLDMTQEADRNKLAAQALEGLKKSKPAALVSAEFAARIRHRQFRR